MSLLKGPRLRLSTLTPFLYPCLDSNWTASTSASRNVLGKSRVHGAGRHQTTAAQPTPTSSVDISQYDHLNPKPLDHSTQLFTDACTLTLHAGGGGHGCISFVREKYIPNGPPDGGDGGSGGNVYIQAVRGETSLHKLARRPILKASRGRNGEGGSRGGRRGDDLLVTVPVGTVVREIERSEQAQKDDERSKWLLYPGTLPKNFTSADLPRLPRQRQSPLNALQPSAPLHLDLDKHMATPQLLVAGTTGGLGNPHFVTKSIPRPKFATKGDEGIRIKLHLELKLLADVGLVGLPNAGKSTLLRALTRSRTRVGNWAFTTLAPNIGTLVLDSYRGRPDLSAASNEGDEPRTHITIADIPGLIEDAHLDRGLGLGFLRHIERAAVLAFVVDLSASDAVAALKGLWREVGMYEKLRDRETEEIGEQSPIADHDDMVSFQPFESSISPGFDTESHTVLPSTNSIETARSGPLLQISTKPWFVVATKADLEGTQDNFKRLQEYLHAVQQGEEEHPSVNVGAGAWKENLHAVPVSALRKEGVESIPGIVLSLLNG